MSPRRWPARAVAVVAAPSAACSAAWPWHGAVPVIAAAGALLLIVSAAVPVRWVGTLGACLVVLTQVLGPLQLARAALTAVLLFTVLEAVDQADLPGNLHGRALTWLGAATATGLVAAVAGACTGALPGWTAAPAALAAAGALILARPTAPHTGPGRDEHR